MTILQTDVLAPVASHQPQSVNEDAANGKPEAAFPYVFRWDRAPKFKGKPVQRRGQECQIKVWGKRTDAVMIRFRDGFEYVTSRRAILRSREFKNSVEHHPSV